MTPAVLFRLLGNWPSLRGLGLRPEERESIRFFNGVRAAALEGRLFAVVVHVPNEGRMSRAVGAILRAMGRVAGAGDYVVTWPKGSAWLEFKSATGRLSPYQCDFRDWCAMIDVPHYVVRTAEDGWMVLVDLGLLDEGAVGR